MTLAGEPDLFSAALSREAKELALEQVASGSSEFTIVALHAVGQLPAGEFTGEDIRRIFTGRGITPNHPNAWGSLIRAALKRKYLNETGRYVSMTAVKSHARKTQLYWR